VSGIIVRGEHIPEQQCVQAFKPPQNRLKRMWEAVSRRSLKTAALVTFAFGAIILATGLVSKNASTVSVLLQLQGIGLMCLSILLYFVSPARSVGCEISNAMTLANMQSIGRILSSERIKSRGIYEPAKDKDPIKVVFPNKQTRNGRDLVPPGYGLYQYARSIGASFTEEDIENELKDLLKNSLELASDVSATIYLDRVWVTISGLATSGLCASLRKEDTKLCCQIGCPICSLVGCIIVDATKSKARIAFVNVKGDNVYVLFELLQG
jgi:hypothetical protein